MEYKRRAVSIQTRVSALSILLVLLTLMAATMSVTTFQIDDLKGLIGSEQLATARLLAAQIGQSLHDRQEALAKISARIDSATMASPAKLQKELYAHPALGVLFNAGFFVTDNKGVAIGSFPESARRLGVDYSDRPYFKPAMEQSRATIGPVMLGRSIGVPAVPLCVPILGPGDRPIGVLVGVTDLSRPNFLSSFPLEAVGKYTSVNLVDHTQMTIITSSEKGRIMEKLPKNPVFGSVKADGGGSRISTNSGNVEVLYSTQRVGQTDWFVTVYTPTPVAFGSVYQLQGRLLWTIVVVTILIGLVHWYLIRSQLKPILRAISAISRLTEAGIGDLRLPVTGRDEIAELLTSFNVLLHSRAEKELERLKYEAISSTSERLESLGILAGGIAHDFNNLLASIFGNIQLVRLYTKDPQVHSRLDRTMQSMDRATALTKQLMTFSKGDALVFVVWDIFSVVEETVKFTLSGSNVAATVRREGSIKLVKFDKHQVAQVIENIALNAMQAMPDGGSLDVLVSSGVSENGTEVVTIELSDSGPGIPSETAAKIFVPFFTTKKDGHGLGLAMCHSIVARHGGRIDVRSVLGQGTTFRIELPTSIERPQVVLETTPATHFGQGKALVMDDDKIVAEVICEMLEHLGYDTVHCASGEPAVSVFRIDRSLSKSITAVFLDLTVPGGMGGLETLGKIKRIDATVPVYVISGYAVGNILAHAESYGFSGCLKKPFLLDDLKRLLEGPSGA